MNANMKVLGFALFLAIYYPYLCYTCWAELNQCQRRIRNLNFSFHITDIWAGIIGIAPSSWLMVYAVNHNNEIWPPMVLAILLPAQLAWIFKGRLAAQIEERSNSFAAGALNSAFYIIMYAMVAVPAAAMYVVAATTCLPAVLLYGALYLRRDVMTPVKAPITARKTMRHSRRI